MAGYLTPGALPTDVVCRALFIPNDEAILANVRGALEELTFTESWVQFGAVTPAAAAAAMLPMFEAFCFNQGSCKLIGEIVCYAGATNPDVMHYLACTGASLLRSAFPDLFTVIGTAYGSADGTHFNIPDLRGRVVVGTGAAPGLSPRSIGDTLGEETHLLVSSEMPVHAHVDSGHAHSTGNSALLGTSAPPPLDALGPNPFPAFTGSGNANIQSSGGGSDHNNMQPSLVLGYYIYAI